MTLTDKILGVETTSAIKAPCRVATTGNITLSGLQTIDGVVLAEGDRVLVWQQTDPVENGIYAADSGLWERTVDMNGQRDIRTGTMVYVALGTLYAAHLFNLISADPLVIDTSELAFSPLSGFVSGTVETITDDEHVITTEDHNKILRWDDDTDAATWVLSPTATAGTQVIVFRANDGDLKTVTTGDATRRCRLDQPGFEHNGIDLNGGLGFLFVETNTDGDNAAWVFSGATAIIA